MKKTAWFCNIIIFFIICLFSIKLQAQAASVGVEVLFRAEPEDDENAVFPVTQSAVSYIGKSAKLICPDGRELTDTITEENKESRVPWINDIMDGGEAYEGYTGRYYFKLADISDLSGLLEGTYTLAEFDCPEGYEIDEAEEVYGNYSRSITFTQEEMKYWSEYSWYQEEGYTFTISVPVKQEGTVSNYYKLPPKAEFSTEYSDVYRNGNYLGTLSLGVRGNYLYNQFWYAKKKQGTWKKLSWEDQSCDFGMYQELKEGKSYYFKVRSGKYIDGETVFGEFSDPVKFKVLKSSVAAYVPQLKVTKNHEKQILCITGNDELGFSVMLYYATEKDGEYKFLMGSYLGKTDISKIKELKKGKTWYLKARFCSTDSLYHNISYGEFSKVLEIKVK